MKYFSRRNGLCTPYKLLTTLMLILILMYLNNSDKKIDNQTKYSFNENKKILLNIITDGETIQTLVKASQETWIRNFPHNILYFIGKQSQSIFIESNIIHLSSNDNDYPPINKTFDMWKYLYENYLHSYDYFMSIDSDTYLNVNNFKSLIDQINCTDCYIGRPAIGEISVRDRLDLHGPYCLGLGYIVSRSTLSNFGPHIDKCRQSIVSNHSDVEIGRCIYKYAYGLSCQKSLIPFQRVMHAIDENGIPRKFQLNNRNQLKIDFPKAPPTDFFSAVLIHPVKNPQSFYQFHRQVELELRPILHPFYLKNSCVSNPIIQNETYPEEKLVPQCYLSKISLNQSIDINNSTHFHAFIITLPNTIYRAKQLILNLEKENIKPEIFYGISNVVPPLNYNLTTGEWNFRLTMLKLFNSIINTTTYEHILILEDDAILHNNFTELFHKLFEDRQCIESTFNGVLLLGATIWSKGWAILDKYQNTEKGLCKNICTKTYGSFAVLMHRSTFQPVIDWLNKKEEFEPYDYVFPHLSRLGYPVRFAYPNLVMSDVRHVSLIRPRSVNHPLYNMTYRAEVHRWDLKQYSIE